MKWLILDLVGSVNYVVLLFPGSVGKLLEN